MADEPHSAFLGLRSNVHFFASSRGHLNLETRIKALALVYDHVVFENGVYNVQIGEGGSFGFDSVYSGHPEDLKPVRSRAGAPFQVLSAPAGTTHFESVIQTTTVRSFRAQFITVLEDLRRVKAKWARQIDYILVSSARGRQMADDLAGTLKSADQALLTEFGNDRPWYLRNALIDHFYTDFARATLEKCDIAPDPVHADLLKRKAAAQGNLGSSKGTEVLSLLVPDLKHVTWDDISHLRRDKGLENLRAKIREFTAEDLLSQKGLFHRLTEEYMRDMERNRAPWMDGATPLLWNLLGHIPFVGLASSIVQATSNFRAASQARSYWTASLFRVRKRAAKRLQETQR